MVKVIHLLSGSARTGTWEASSGPTTLITQLMLGSGVLSFCRHYQAPGASFLSQGNDQWINPRTLYSSSLHCAFQGDIVKLLLV